MANVIILFCIILDTIGILHLVMTEAMPIAGKILPKSFITLANVIILYNKTIRHYRHIAFNID